MDSDYSSDFWTTYSLVIWILYHLWHCCDAQEGVFVLPFEWHWCYGLTRKTYRVRKPPQGRHYASGDLIVSNHISYIDTIYLWVAYKSPLFVRRVTSEGSQVEVGGLMGALRRDVSSSNKTSGLQTFKSLKEALEWAKTTTSGPLIYFAEETTSNGRGLLTFSSLLEETPHEQVSIHLVGLRYPYTKFSPSFTTGSVWMHLLSLLSQVNILNAIVTCARS